MDKIIPFRVSRDLATQAHQRAEREGVPLSAVLRSFLHDYADGRNASPEIYKASQRLATELRKVDTNLTQIARHLASGALQHPLSTELQQRLAQVAAELDQLHGELLAGRDPTTP